MATATYVQAGDSIDYTPASDVSAGEVVVQGNLIGIAKLDIAAGNLGALAVKGIFDLPKATGASTAIAAGKKVYWNAGAAQATETTTNNEYLGKTVAAAADADTTVRVRVSQ